ncbi:hypothetical protein OF83DRAFT_1086872 [Amylostereum chailletii]|nr:hypothetical protein OF83DRAFT_1086872 [Amylostereum chailletii]
MTFLRLTLLALPFLYYVRADVSLYIPGFDPQPLSAADLGVDSAGRTTWEIVTGVQTDTDQDFGLVGTATLIEGASDAHLEYGNAEISVTLDISCALSDGVADCTANQGYPMTPMPFGTQAAVPLLMQGGGSVSGLPAETGSAGTGSVAASVATGSASARTSTNSGAASASASAVPDSAMGVRVGLAVVLGSALAGVLLALA